MFLPSNRTPKPLDQLLGKKEQATMLTAAEARYLRETLARRNPELFERLNAEVEAMTEAEIAAISCARVGNTLSAAEARFLETRDRILARRNPELLAREKAEFEAMSDAELAAIARPAPMAEGFNESSLAHRYGTDVTEAATGLLIPDASVTSSGELRIKWEALDRLLVEAEEIADKETGGVSAPLYQTRRVELQAPILDCFNEMEARIANMVMTTIGDCLIPLSLLKIRREYLLEPDELDDRLVDNLIEGLAAMATAGG
jgi:hypothetical protein